MLTVAVVRKIKLPTARLAAGRTVRTFCSNLEISYATGGWKGKEKNIARDIFSE